jgi:uncharacterized protein (DUF697 family)
MQEKKDQKPGYKTTEFWVTLATCLTGIGVACGILGQGEADTLVSSVERIAGGLIAAIPAVGYSLSRAKAKSN